MADRAELGCGKHPQSGEAMTTNPLSRARALCDEIAGETPDSVAHGRSEADMLGILVGEIERLRLACAALREQAQQADDRWMELGAEYERTITSLRTELEAAKHRCEDLVLRNTQLRQALHAAENRAMKAEVDLESTETDRADWRERAQWHGEQAERLRRELEAANRRIKELEQKLKGAERILRAV